MNQAVTLLTRDASLDNLSLSDYRDIFNELREKMSLDKLVVLLNSQYSKAQWSKFEHSPEMMLTRNMRNELRAAMGLALLPPTVAECTAQASPDASVWRVGEGTPEHVIMVGSEPVTLHVSSGVSVVDAECHVTRITTGQIQRKRYTRPCVSEAQERRFLALPVRSAWRDVIDAGLSVLESKTEVNPYLLTGAELERAEKATW